MPLIKTATVLAITLIVPGQAHAKPKHLGKWSSFYLLVLASCTTRKKRRYRTPRLEGLRYFLHGELPHFVVLPDGD